MKELIILKMGEVVLKGLNRDNFENTLLKNARRRLEDLGEFKVYRSQSTAYCEPLTDDCDMDEAFARLCKVFGFVALARCAVVEKDMAKILEAAGDYLAPQLGAARTFKVNAKRSDKGFPKKSPEICADVGEYLLEKFPHLKVDVIEPQVTVTVEIRDFGAYIHADAVKGAGGLPVGTSKKALLLLSGGIDSPVAGHMTAKRGVFLSAVYFETPPYTGAAAKEKVVSLAKTLKPWCGAINLFSISLTKVQEALYANCREEYFTLLLRRFMMRCAAELAKREDCLALVTGESVGQVASQTIPALAVTNDAAGGLPVLRPLIGLDKEEIIVRSRQIGAFDISILPYEDCCAMFTPKHPKTNPSLAEVLEEETKIDVAALTQEAMATLEKIPL